ncbi:MAG: ABC transporter ATP-binding protein [Rhabdaerophilum sp.]
MRDVSFCVKRGGMVAIIGESGGGKSLIAQAIMGLLPQGFVAHGQMKLGETSVDLANTGQLQRLWANQTLLLPQEPRTAFDPTMRVQRQLELAATSNGMAVDAALDAVDLSGNAARQFPFELSGGMAQRALIASSLVGNTPIIVADEPTKGLDANRVTQVADLFLDLAARGRSLIVITHDLAFLTRLGGQIIVLEDGLVRERGDTLHVFSHPHTPYARAWVSADPKTWEPCRRCCNMDNLVLTAHGLSAGYTAAKTLFSDIDLHLPAGGVIGIAGPSGCGKTTLGNVLLGIKAPLSGEVRWGDALPYRDLASRKKLRRRYQKLHQDPVSTFVTQRTIGQQLLDLAQVEPTAADPERFGSGMERLKLSNALLGRYPAEISGGEAQRLALLRILLLQPKVIVADEPTSRLDPVNQKQTIALLRKLVDEEQLALVLIAHDERLLAATADEVITLAQP